MNNFNAVDLFAGCGGLSEGFRQAGFSIIAEVEMNSWACETLKTRHLFQEFEKIGKSNKYHDYVKGIISKEQLLNEHPKIRENISKSVIQAELSNNNINSVIQQIYSSMSHFGVKKINVLLGGPPCQAYSLVGRARDPQRMQADSRSTLYEHYLKILSELKPDFFVFENVPGLITAKTKGELVFSKILVDFQRIIPSYNIAPSFDEYSKNPRQYLLDTNNYGIPQKRKRVIFIGYKQDLVNENPQIQGIFKRILDPKLYSLAMTTVRDAISDLPPIKPNEGSDYWYGSYSQEASSSYQKIMRRNSAGISNYKARQHMAEDIERYKFFIDHHLNGNGAANLIDLLSERPDLKPAHNNIDKFIDRFKVQWWDKPSSTIMAHISHDGHYYIHPDIKQCRSFTVREAARCQSFPDNYFFEGPRTEQFRQVGNAVPPMFAEVIAKSIIIELKKIYGQ